MEDCLDLVKRAKAYVKKHPPDTGYTVKAMETVCAGKLDAGTNIMVQFALQFDGKETVEDQTQWDTPERRLPYGDARSLDARSDCSSFVQNLYDLFFGINIGTWTEAQWKKYKSKQVDFKNLRPCDLIFWNFKKGRNVSHVAMYIGNNKIIHTTSSGNPLRVEASSYSAKSRVGCVRILSDAQYNNLIYGGEVTEELPLLKLGSSGSAVTKLQELLNAIGAGLKVDGDFGKKTLAAVKDYQKKKGLNVDGVVGKFTWDSLLSLK